MSQSTVLLTGANGFLGSHLLEALLKQGYKVVVLKRSTSNLWRIKHLENQYKSYDVDVQPIELAFEEQRIDSVIHTACHYGRNNDPIHDVVESNLMYGLRILSACLKFNTDTFFNTDTLLKKNLNTYTLSKKQFVEWLKQSSSQLQIVNLKLEHMYGPKDDSTKFVPWIISQLNSKVDEIKLTAGEQDRDFIYIDDVVAAYMLALKKSSQLERFNEFDVGTGNLISVKSFLEKLKEQYELMSGKTNTQLAFGALPYREGEMMSVEVDNQGLVDLGWVPKTNLENGLKNILKSDV